MKDRSELAVIEQISTHERLGIAFARTNVGLCRAANNSLSTLKESGRFEALRRKWFDESREG